MRKIVILSKKHHFREYLKAEHFEILVKNVIISIKPIIVMLLLVLEDICSA